MIFDLKEFWIQQAEWSQKAFGPDRERGPAGPLKHLIKEANECLANPADHMEYVDCLFLVFDAARRAGLTYDEMLMGCFWKLAINRRRKWSKPKDGEACEHVREEESHAPTAPSK